MVKPSKLYEQLLRHPAISFRDFQRLLEAFGFRLDRVKGSHHQYVHPLIRRPFPVQPDGKDAKRYQIRELLDLIEEHGLHIET